MKSSYCSYFIVADYFFLPITASPKCFIPLVPQLFIRIDVAFPQGGKKSSSGYQLFYTLLHLTSPLIFLVTEIINFYYKL